MSPPTWTMFDDRLEVEATLVAHSDLHIGRLDAPTEGNARDNRLYVLRDAEDRPLLPASSLKGVLRQAMDTPDSLLGFAMDGADKGLVARFWLQDAPLITADKAPKGLATDKETFETSHVGLDPKTGAADPNKLYKCERVARGATFAFRAIWYGSNIMDVQPLLSPFASGLSLGKGTTKGYGRVALDPGSLKATRQTTDERGRVQVTPLTEDETADLRNALGIRWQASADARVAATERLILTCEGPFLSMRGAEERVPGEGETTLPLERDERPALNPESLIGALRARARWCAAVKQAKETPEAAQRTCVDDPNRSPADITALSSVERLFGVTGFAGLLRLVDLRSTGDTHRVTLTSVGLDRITGAGRDGFLYKEETFLGVTFYADFAWRKGASEADREFWSYVLKDVMRNGLDLGHGASKGFGWFDVERKDLA